MSQDVPTGGARQRVLTVAGALFGAQGYRAVTLKHIATALQIRQPALYYHVPGGKEDLFALVTRQTLQLHQRGLQAAIASVEPRITLQLHAVADHLLSHPPFDMARFLRSDLPALSTELAAELEQLSQESLIAPLEHMLASAYQRGDIRMVDPTVMAHVLLASFTTLHEIHRVKQTPANIVARDVIETIVNGLQR